MARDPQQAGFFDAERQLPEGLLYEPDFLTREEEDDLVAHVAPLPLREAKFREYFAKRRVAHFHDEVDAPRYDVSSIERSRPVYASTRHDIWQKLAKCVRGLEEPT
jgi:hypothetical protein